MNKLKDLLENVIKEAIEDPRELIDTDKLPSALVIAKRIEELESALQKANECLKEITIAGPAYPAKIATQGMMFIKLALAQS